MEHGAKCALVAVLALSVSMTVLAAGPTTGTPPFRSLGGGPDVINLGNLNVHYSMPVFGRAGRGMPFSYALAYDSSVWQIAASAWTPASTSWGLTRDVAAAVGSVQVSAHQFCQNIDPGIEYTFSNFVDSAGTLHPFGAAVSGYDCHPATTQTVQLTDGSGITITVDTTPSATVTLKSGEVIHPVLSTAPTGAGNRTDSNGNQITSTVSGTTTKFFDTLSSTVPVLIIDASVPTSVKYNYAAPADPDPSNPPTKVTVTYVNYNVQTKFGCSGINEYGPIQNSLVDRVTLPDGSYYQFTYEVTPQDTHTPHYVTGRIASVRFPTGGTISYTYQGGDSGQGIFCADGSTAGFTRTTPDGTWTYVRTGTSPNYITTITTPVDPATGQQNHTVINFQGEYETLRQVYQGAATGTPLETVTTCYNGTPSNPCPGTAVTTPFSQYCSSLVKWGATESRRYPVQRLRSCY